MRCYKRSSHTLTTPFKKVLSLYANKMDSIDYPCLCLRIGVGLPGLEPRIKDYESSVLTD